MSSAHQAFVDARVRGLVPLLVEHDVLIRLKDLAGQADLGRETGAGTPRRAPKQETDLLLGLGPGGARLDMGGTPADSSPALGRRDAFGS